MYSHVSYNPKITYRIVTLHTHDAVGDFLFHHHRMKNYTYDDIQL